MNAMHKEKRTCPVCGMDAKDSTIFTVYKGNEYYFCTAQCRENFGARPRLYVGKLSVKYAGKEIIKRRSFRLEQPLKGEMEHQLKDALYKMMGIRGVRVKGRNIAVTYNLLEATAEQLEQVMSDAGAALGSDWPARLKYGWVHYTEETELNNLATGRAAPPVKR